MKTLFKILLWVVGISTGLFILFLAGAMLVYPPQYIFRVMAYRESDAFDWQKFPSHPLSPAPQVSHFTTLPDPGVPALFETLSESEDWDSFLEQNQTQAFIVLQEGEVLYEKYFNNTQRDSIVTSFSIAKSFTSALVGIAISEGYIQSVDDPITIYLPELATRDKRFEQINIRHLLLMASGLEYEEFRPLLFNSDDPLTTYHPNQRRISLENTRIIDPPGLYFHYNKYHPQLLGMILERTTRMRVTDYLQTRIWDPLGMEFSGSWSTDSEASDFEKMETGVNGRAIDFAKFGMLFLNAGAWNGQQLIPEAWVAESTQPYFPEDHPSYYPEFFNLLPGRAYYTYMWWGFARGGEIYDFAAEGDKGQYIFISPHKNLVIVRHGIDYGVSNREWNRLFYDFASQY